MSSPQVLTPGSVIGNYEIIESIAKGGMGMVYHARHTFIKRDVALKVLFPHLANDKEFTQRFLREGQSMAQLRHPNIVEVYDASFANEYYFLAIELLTGGTIYQLLVRLNSSKQTMPVEQALQVTRQIALALDYAHSKGFVHRDIKPSNIMVAADGRYVLTDFGIVYAEHAEKLTRNLETLGTPEYMSPEQAQGVTVDGRSDIYSLGIVLYEMLAGRPPFRGETPWSIVYQHIKDPPPPITLTRTDVPVPAREILEKAMAKKPEDRFQSGREMAAAIDRALATLSTGAATTNIGQPPPPIVAPSEGAAPAVESASPAREAPIEAAPSAKVVPVLPISSPQVIKTVPLSQAAQAYPPIPIVGPPSPVQRQPAAKPAGRGRWLIIAGIVLALIMIIGAGAFVISMIVNSGAVSPTSIPGATSAVATSAPGRPTASRGDAATVTASAAGEATATRPVVAPSIPVSPFIRYIPVVMVDPSIKISPAASSQDPPSTPAPGKPTPTVSTVSFALQNYTIGRESWGKPTSADGCSKFDDSVSGWLKYEVSFDIANTGKSSIDNWAPVFLSSINNVVSPCTLQAGSSTIAAGNTSHAAYILYMQGQYLATVQIRTPSLTKRLCADPLGRSLSPC